MRKILLWLVSVTFLSLTWVVGQAPDEKLRLVFCDVGQGDASLIIKGSFQMLVDTGPKNGGVVNCLGKHLPFWDREIEVFVNSHPETDHLGDLKAVSDHYRIERLVVNGKLPGEKMSGLIETVSRKDAKLMIVGLGDRLRYGDLYFDILWPEQKTDDLVAWLDDKQSRVLGSESSLNQYSVVLKLSYGSFGALFTGDIGEKEEALVGINELVDVLKVAHHGSKYSSSAEFLAVVRPKLAVISVGRNNYGHPTNEALARLTEAGAKIWRTDNQGELEIVSDGKRYWEE